MTTTAPIPLNRLRGRSRPGPPRLLGEIGDRLEPGVREHRQRQREHELVPRRRHAERQPARQGAAGEEQREAEHDEQQLRDEIEQRHRDPEGVEPRAPHEPRRRDQGDQHGAGDRVARMARDRVDAEREPEVVREEQRRQRDHDQVVEEEHPAGEEAREVVERNPDEGRRASRLADRRRPLRVRQRHDQEERPDDPEDRRRESERVQRDDPEGEVDRGGDLAVGDRGESRSVEGPFQAG